MQTHLVTGYKGSEHIKSADQGSFNAAFSVPGSLSWKWEINLKVPL